jgi:class 3 adenylate cyclase
MEPRIQYAKTSDGVNIAFATSGDGPPLLVMNAAGAPVSHVQAEWQLPYYRTAIERTSRHWTLLRYDPRGSGLSDREVTDWSLSAYVLDLEAVVDRLELPSFRLIASGSNLPIVITYVCRHPERVSHLVLWGGAVRRPEIPQAIANLTELTSMGWKLASELLAVFFEGISEADFAGQWAELIRESVSQERFIAMTQATSEWDVSDLLGSVRVPTLVAYNRRHPYSITDQQRTIAAAIPNARLSAHDDYATGKIGPSASAAIGAFLREGTKEKAPDPALPSGTAVILFADIVDSTALTEHLGDTAFREKARDLDTALRATIREHAGTPIEGKLLGDGVLAVFTSARQAIEAALACGRAGDEGSLALHLGLHAGDVIREDNNVYGGAVNIAARISGLSAPGEVLVSETVRSLARTSAGVQFEDRGEQELKGVGEAVRVWAVVEAE